jgi:hypothetical protein
MCIVKTLSVCLGTASLGCAPNCVLLVASQFNPFIDLTSEVNSVVWVVLCIMLGCTHCGCCQLFGVAWILSACICQLCLPYSGVHPQGTMLQPL